LTVITSPVLISSFAASTRRAVSRFSLPNPSSAPQTQADFSGAPGTEGKWVRGGKFSRSGSHGYLVSSTEGSYDRDWYAGGAGEGERAVERADATAVRRLDGDDMVNWVNWSCMRGNEVREVTEKGIGSCMS